jgi:hypothetical protein
MFTDVSEVCTASIITLITEVASASETSVNIYRTTRRYNPEHGHLVTSCTSPYNAKAECRNYVGYTGWATTRFTLVIYLFITSVKRLMAHPVCAETRHMIEVNVRIFGCQQ